METTIFTRISKSVRMLGFFGLMMALAAAFATGPSGSASAAEINGKLNVHAFNAMQAGLGGINGATIAVVNSKGEAAVKGATTADGQFSSYVPQGSYTLKVTAPGFQGFSKAFKVEAGKTVNIEAGLTPAPSPAPATDPVAQPTGKLSVHVQNMTTGKALVNATVLVLDGNGKRVAKALTNNVGDFEIKVPVGPYKVVINADNYKEYRESFTVVANQVTNLKAGLEPVNAATADPSFGSVSWLSDAR